MELPRRTVMFRRALTRRCPVCGSGRLFRHWVQRVDRCPRCSLPMLREPGQWTGGLGMNAIVSFGTLLVVLLGGTLLTWPDLNVGFLVIGSIFAVAVMPVLFYPISQTLWLAIDLSVNPLRPGETIAPADRTDADPIIDQAR